MIQKFNDLTKTNSLKANKLTEELIHLGFNFSSGVPCGVLKTIIKNIQDEPSIMQIPSQNEPEAIGIAAGAYLAGKKPLIYMQNSGLIKSTNELTSLILPCQIPLLSVIAYRGCKGEDAPQHFINGDITKKILDLLNIYYTELSNNQIEQKVNECYEFMNKNKKPAVLLIKRGWDDSYYHSETTMNKTKKAKSDFESRNENLFEIQNRIVNLEKNQIKSMNRDESIDAIMQVVKEKDAIFSTTGLISRSVFERYDAPNQFYNTGSFGLVSSLGLGFSLSKPQNKTIVIDGDASLLTNFGTLTTIGSQKPENLIHIVLDNNAYGSCSEETSDSNTANFSVVAATQGYKKVFIVNQPGDLYNSIEEARLIKGPVMIHTKISLGGPRSFKRPLKLTTITQRFKDYFN